MCVNVTGERPFSCFATNLIPNLVATAGFGSEPIVSLSTPIARMAGNEGTTFRFPPYSSFQKHYRDKSITREDLFHYVYALLHHPEYRTRYAENLKRELPRIPLSGKAADFRLRRRRPEVGRPARSLREAEPYPLKQVENPEAPLDWRVEAMKLNKEREPSATTTSSRWPVPPEAFDYRLGNRSALEWVIDQYRVSRDEHGKITSDPNRRR